jgi:hypothetical protein
MFRQSHKNRYLPLFKKVVFDYHNESRRRKLSNGVRKVRRGSHWNGQRIRGYYLRCGSDERRSKRVLGSSDTKAQISLGSASSAAARMDGDAHGLAFAGRESSTFRVRPGTLRGITKFSEHEAD